MDLLAYRSLAHPPGWTFQVEVQNAWVPLGVEEFTEAVALG